VNTAGHRGVAEDAGIPLLREAIRNVDPTFGKPEALLLGNWVTDLSQLYDPPVYEGFSAKVQAAFDKGLSGLHEMILNEKEEEDGELVALLTGPLLRAAIKELNPWIHATAVTLAGQQPANRGQVAAVVGHGIRIKGYFKYVLPEHKDGKNRIPFDVYDELITKRYTQYFPHEHLDRPPVRLEPTAVYASGFARGIPSEPAVERVPDLYQYLRDQLAVLAGSMTKLEREWQETVRGTITAGGGPGSLGTEKFHGLLAELGHLLHTIEDFYAHSNFIELYATGAWPDLQPMFFEGDQAEILERRLLRYDPSRAESTVREDFVVTGYFDMWDTLVSVLHVVEELLGERYNFEVRDPAKEVGDAVRATRNVTPATLEEEYDAWLESINELFVDYKKALDDDNNRVAQQYKKLFADEIKAIENAGQWAAIIDRLLNQTEFGRRVPPRIRDSINEFVIGLHTAIKIGTVAISLYRAVNLVRTLLTAPLELLRSTLTDEAFQFLRNSSAYYTRKLLIYQLMLAGRDGRLGSHSLLAKDYEGGWLYEYQRACATAVHYLIVDQFCDYLRPGAPADGSTVNWQEFFEQVCVNPLWARNGVSFQLTASGVLEVPPGRPPLKERLNHLAAANVSAGTVQPGWATIAAATFGVDDSTELEKLLAAVARAERSSSRPMSVVVPDQVKRMYATGSGSATGQPVWCDDIIRREREPGHKGHGWEVVKGYRKYATRQSEVLTPVAITRLTLDEAKKIADKAADKRKTAERSYNDLTKVAR
jgi:hypothetical protein